MDELKKSILAPVIFFSWFKFPLTIRELRRYLWRSDLSEGEIRQLLKSMPDLRREGELVWYGDFSNERDSRQGVVNGFWGKILKWRWLFRHIPFLRAVFVTNTLSYGNVKQGSDIDLMIVGTSNRLWTCRAVLMSVMTLLGLRVRGVNKHARFSPELWLGDQHLDLRPVALDNDYHLSFWLADFTLIWPGGEPAELWRANPWLKQDLPIAWRSPRQLPWPMCRPSWAVKLIERWLGGRLGDGLERRLKSWQSDIISRNAKRLSVNPSIVVGDNIIKLHFNDRRAAVRDEIERVLSEVLAES